MIRVLFVCKGNICRSPLAQGIFDSVIAEQGLDKRVSSDSAGTSAFHSGEQPDERSIKIAKENGIDLDHQSRQLRLRDYSDFDYMIPMDLMNQTQLLQMKNEAISPTAQIVLMRKFDPKGESIEVEDPWAYDYDAFVNTYNTLYRSIIYFVEYLKENYNLI